jgi:hypothetical protein
MAKIRCLVDAMDGSLVTDPVGVTLESRKATELVAGNWNVAVQKRLRIEIPNEVWCWVVLSISKWPLIGIDRIIGSTV